MPTELKTWAAAYTHTWGTMGTLVMTRQQYSLQHLGLEHLLPLGREEVLEAGVGAGQRAGADGEDEEQHQRQRGRHIHHLARHLHTGQGWVLVLQKVPSEGL